MIQADTRALCYLADLTDKDIRSCLNTLQFIKSKSNCGTRLSTRVTHGMLQSMPIGRKDFSRGLFDVWDAILQKHKPKDRKDTDHCRGTAQTEWSKLYRMIMDQKSDKIMEGVYENYLNLDFQDIDGTKVLSASEWMHHGDIWTTGMKKNQWFFLFGYIPFVSILVHQFCGSEFAYRTQYPRSSWAHRQKLKENRAIIQELLMPNGNVAGKGVVNWTTTSATLDVIPYLLHIIGTTVEPKPRAMMNRHAKRKFAGILNTLIDCNITFKPVTTEFGDVAMSPPIQQIAQFSPPEPGRPSDRANPDQKYNSLGQDYMQFVAHELKLEKIRRSDRERKFAEQQARYDKKEYQKNDRRTGSSLTQMSPLANKFKTLSAERNTPFAKGAKQKSASKTPTGGGMFARDRMQASQPSQSAPDSPKKNFMTKAEKKIMLAQKDLELRYISGYTNAVKRKTKTKDWY